MAFPINAVYSVFSLIGFVLCMLPLSWHLQAWNIGTCAFMLWTGFGCLNYFINSVIWNGRFDNVAPVWCDISVHYIMALGAAIPACSLCINRRLYHIATSTTVNKTRTDRRREISIDLSLCLGVPILSMVADYIVQGNRFDIYEDYGCNPVVYDTWVALVIYNLPAIVIGLVSAVYCLLSIRAFKHRRAQFNSLLSAHSTQLDSSRYFRLMAIAGVDVAFTVPTASLVLYLNAQPGLLSPWLGWEDTHFGFEQVNVFPAVLWRESGVAATALELTRWFMPFTAVVFFAVFGLTRDARARYMTLFGAVKTKLGSVSSFQSESTCATRGTLPLFVKREKPRQISFDTISSSMFRGHLSDKSTDSNHDLTRPVSQITLNDVGGALAPIAPPRSSVVVSVPLPISRFSSTTSMALDLV